MNEYIRIWEERLLHVFDVISNVISIPYVAMGWWDKKTCVIMKFIWLWVINIIYNVGKHFSKSQISMYPVRYGVDQA